LILDEACTFLGTDHAMFVQAEGVLPLMGKLAHLLLNDSAWKLRT